MQVRPRVFWIIIAYLILNIIVYSWFMYWQGVWRVIEEGTIASYVYLLAIIVLHSIKLLAIVLLWSRHRIIYYLQISSMLAAVIGWLLVISYVPRQYELLLIANMIGYTMCLGAWLNPSIKRLYDIVYRQVV